jgi:hypothetical protein
LALAFRRHAELDHQEIAVQASRHAGKALSLEVVADAMETQIERWESAQISLPVDRPLRDRACRISRSLTGRRHCRIAGALRATLHEALRVLELPDPTNLAAALIAFTEGVLLDQARVGKPALGPRSLRKTLLAILQASEKVE